MTGISEQEVPVGAITVETAVVLQNYNYDAEPQWRNNAMKTQKKCVEMIVFTLCSMETCMSLLILSQLSLYEMGYLDTFQGQTC